jgi:carboxyl-terminal processing protease
MNNRVRILAIWLGGFSLGILGLAAFLVWSAGPSSLRNPIKQSYGLDDKDILLYLEAITRIQQSALFLDSQVPRETTVYDTLKAYLGSTDPFSDFLTPKEYDRVLQAQQERSLGVGLEIEKTSTGDIICFPIRNGPAEQAGIRAGDRLKSINGALVNGKSLLSIVSLSGAMNQKQVDFVVVTDSGVEKKVRVTRSDAKFEPVSVTWVGKVPIVTLRLFTPKTGEYLKDVLSRWQDSQPLILDLRDNPGGDLDAAIASANLFLQKGMSILQVVSRTGEQKYLANADAYRPVPYVYLWQNRGTASAAEAFIGSLTENGKGISIGTKSAGKGTKQDIMKLSNGSALVLTTGYLLTPGGNDYRGRGLDPTFALAQEHPETSDYLAKLQEVLVNH